MTITVSDVGPESQSTPPAERLSHPEAPEPWTDNDLFRRMVDQLPSLGFTRVELGGREDELP